MQPNASKPVASHSLKEALGSQTSQRGTLVLVMAGMIRQARRGSRK
jgi:hypothetical protein